MDKKTKRKRILIIAGSIFLVYIIVVYINYQNQLKYDAERWKETLNNYENWTLLERKVKNVKIGMSEWALQGEMNSPGRIIDQSDGSRLYLYGIENWEKITETSIAEQVQIYAYYCILVSSSGCVQEIEDDYWAKVWLSKTDK